MLLLCLNISSNPNLFDRSLIPSSQGVPDSHQLSIQPHCTCEGCNPWKAGLAFISIDTSRTSRNAGRPNKGPTKSCEVGSLPFKICMMWWNYCDLEIWRYMKRYQWRPAGKKTLCLFRFFWSYPLMLAIQAESDDRKTASQKFFRDQVLYSWTSDESTKSTKNILGTKRSCAQESPNWTGASHLWCAVPVRSSIYKFVWEREIDRISRRCFIFVGLTRPYLINQVQLFLLLFQSRKLAEFSGTCVFWMFKGLSVILGFLFSRSLRQNTWHPWVQNRAMKSQWLKHESQIHSQITTCVACEEFQCQEESIKLPGKAVGQPKTSFRK